MDIRYFQKGFNYAQDGPGNRLVYHLIGCNMRCPWCANPEGMDLAAPGRAEPVDAVAEAVLSARPLFIDGGGLTLTGGEVTAQWDAAAALLAGVRGAGVNTCVETNAAHPHLTALMPLVDHWIADFKHPDDAAHRRFTGIGNDSVKRNIAALAGAGADLLLRVPLIHGVNDDEAALDGFRAFFGAFAARKNVRLEILPYHEYGRDKWLRLNGAYAMQDAFVTAARVREVEDALRALGLTVVRT